MKISRYTDSQILAILKQAESGSPIPVLCREHGMSSASFYEWRAKFGGMDASMMKRMKELEDEDRRLKKMYADERLKAEMVQETLAKKWRGHLGAKRWLGKRCQPTAPAFAWFVRLSASARPATVTDRFCRMRMR